jgi:hypothetical protein
VVYCLTFWGLNIRGLASVLQDSDCAIAEFVDGSTWTVTDLTVAGLKARTEAASRGKANNLWEGIHAETKQKLWIKTRADRSILVSLFKHTDGKKDGQQICQVSTRDLEIELAVTIMTQIGTKFAKAEISEKDLYSFRDQLLVSHGKHGARTRRVTENARLLSFGGHQSNFGNRCPVA